MNKFLMHESAIAPLPKREGNHKSCTISSNIASMSASHCQIPISPLLYLLRQHGCGLHAASGGDEVAAHHDVCLHPRAAVAPQLGHQVREGRVLGLGHRAQLPSLINAEYVGLLLEYSV